MPNQRSQNRSFKDEQRCNISVFIPAIRPSLACQIARHTRVYAGRTVSQRFFIGLLGIIVAAGIGAAMSVYANITRQTQADQMLSQAVARVSDEFSYALSVEGNNDIERQSGGNEIYFVSATLHEPCALINSEFGRGIELAANSGYSNLAPTQHGLKAVISELVYYRKAKDNISAGTWTFRIQIVPENATETTVYAETTMTVKRIGS